MQAAGVRSIIDGSYKQTLDPLWEVKGMTTDRPSKIILKILLLRPSLSRRYYIDILPRLIIRIGPDDFFISDLL